MTYMPKAILTKHDKSQKKFKTKLEQCWTRCTGGKPRQDRWLEMSSRHPSRRQEPSSVDKQLEQLFEGLAEMRNDLQSLQEDVQELVDRTSVTPVIGDDD